MALDYLELMDDPLQSTRLSLERRTRSPSRIIQHHIKLLAMRKRCTIMTGKKQITLVSVKKGQEILLKNGMD